MITSIDKNSIVLYIFQQEAGQLGLLENCPRGNCRGEEDKQQFKMSFKEFNIGPCVYFMCMCVYRFHTCCVGFTWVHVQEGA